MKVTDNKKHNELTCVRCPNIKRNFNDVKPGGLLQRYSAVQRVFFSFEALFVYGATRYPLPTPTPETTARARRPQGSSASI